MNRIAVRRPGSPGARFLRGRCEDSGAGATARAVAPEPASRVEARSVDTASDPAAPYFSELSYFDQSDCSALATSAGCDWPPSIFCRFWLMVCSIVGVDQSAYSSRPFSAFSCFHEPTSWLRNGSLVGAFAPRMAGICCCWYIRLIAVGDEMLY